MINEPGVTLTDYALTIECIVIVFLLLKQPGRTIRLYRWFIIFFCALGLSAFIGGTSHGFFTDETTLFYRLIWKSTLISLGAVGVSAYMLGVFIWFGENCNIFYGRIIISTFALYSAVVILVNDSFWIAIAYYLPASAFLLLSLLRSYFKHQHEFLLSGIIGMLLTFMAAVVQQSGYSIHPVWLNHNVIYHLLMALAIFLLFKTVRGYVSIIHK